MHTRVQARVGVDTASRPAGWMSACKHTHTHRWCPCRCTRVCTRPRANFHAHGRAGVCNGAGCHFSVCPPTSVGTCHLSCTSLWPFARTCAPGPAGTGSTGSTGIPPPGATQAPVPKCPRGRWDGDPGDIPGHWVALGVLGGPGETPRLWGVPRVWGQGDTWWHHVVWHLGPWVTWGGDNRALEWVPAPPGGV